MPHTFTILLGALALSLSINGDQQPIRPDPLWQSIAKADLVVSGTLVGKNNPRRELTLYPGYNHLRIIRPRLLKGVSRPHQIETAKFGFSRRAAMSVMTYLPLLEPFGAAEPWWIISERQLSRSNRKPIVAFLVDSEDVLYFDHFSYSLQLSTPDLERRIQNEVEQQRTLLEAYPTSTFALPDRHHDSVRRLIEQFLNADTQKAAFRALEDLGTNAVPSIIRLMNDRRPLPDRNISLRNKAPNAFEAIRHYGVDNVLQALDAILNQITGKSFGPSWNNLGPEKERKAVAGWRLYLIYTQGTHHTGSHSI